MFEREQEPSALRPTKGSLCIVMACTDMTEAEQVGRLLSELNMGCLVTYSRTQDMVLNAPQSKVALFILATQDTPAVVGRTLKWLRHRWPRSPITVVGDAGCGQHEVAARQSGACFLTRPVAPEQWQAVLVHALGDYRPVGKAAKKANVSPAGLGGGTIQKSS